MKKTGANNSRNSRPGSAARQGVRSTSSSRSSSSNRSTTSSSKKTSSKKKAKKTPIVPIVVAAAALVIAGVGGGYLWKTGYFTTKYDVTMADGQVMQLTEEEIRAALAGDTFVDGVYIDGINVSGMTKDAALQAVIAAQPAAPISMDISLNLDDEIIPLDLSSLPISNNANEVVDEAFNLLKPTGNEDINALVELYQQREALKATPAQFTTAYTLNSDELSPLVHGALDSYVHEAVEAELTGFDVENCVFEYVPSENGYTVDIEKAINDVKAMLDAGTYAGIVDVDAEVDEPEFTTEIIESEFGRVSSSSSTTTAVANRNHNINITCERINGLVIEAGSYFSFNEFIGQRTAANGYREAGVIVDGRSETDFGGGICQVSTMIYQSAVKANLEINQSQPHMWPSSYADVGTDAAVDWPAQDLKFTNTSGYPIILIANWNPNNSVVTVEIYGHLLPDGQYITIDFERTGSTPAGTTYVQNTSMPVGQTNQVRGSHNGVTARAWAVWHDADGNEINRVEMRPSNYPVIPTIIEVGTLQPDGTQAGFDAATGTVTPTYVAPEETQPSETTPPTEGGGSDPAPVDPPPAETQAPDPEPQPQPEGEQ